MSSQNNVFHSKILMFGEYTLITGSKGIAFPLPQFQGQFAQADNNGAIKPNFKLDEFCTFLKGSNILSENMDLDRFESDIQNGIYFDSNIPHGYGIGSSGALCAAVYARYASNFERKDDYTNDELNFLKDIMALMEGFYHGTSSGLDCLISLINRPMLITGRNTYELIDYPNLDVLGKFYLQDSNIQRKTAPFVHSFLEKYDNDANYKQETNNFTSLVDDIIQCTINGDKNAFKDNLYKLSHFQYLHFADMIPDDIKKTWLIGLETKQYLMKLCGAGGGGFFLIYSDDEDYNQACLHTCVN